ncbi:GDSL-type esterase/lipase family protein [Actinomadura sp. WMMB 499]|uniref:GDSL-type esterase/lipase family protein n=1 Tax=Actinomadura sp. WMMB 499 TaxID=1219491 RepID=UPI001246E781|nr:GDSL-type esterase/lipase family protein [Actinomadura sp. WMMB 499]QFG22736.1 GDSL family lipase [Actinomadura sp. WMMB 499]
MVRARSLAVVLVGALVVAVLSPVRTPVHASAAAPVGACPSRWVASWTASPTDGAVPFDASLGAVPTTLDDQTVRMVITPHLGGSSVRVRLSNRFGREPVTFGRVTIAPQVRGATTGRPVPVTFGGAASVTVPAGEDAVSDAAALTFAAFDPLAVSVHLPDRTGGVTKHWNANATSYYADARTGDLTARTGAEGFANETLSWLFVAGLDVRSDARAVVAFGDSITDGFVGGSPFAIPADRSVADTNGRYPDELQRRADAAGLGISVVNAGIGSNQLLGSLGLMDGPSGVSRFRADALDVPGASGVLVLEGINDLGLRIGVTPAEIQDGYVRLIDRAHAAGKRIWLGTLTPAANALVNGTLTAPNSERYRQRINAWIRSQTLADGVVDFDAAVRDPADPSRLLPAYASPDNLHPGPRGYERMAAAVPLDLFDDMPCAGPGDDL